jgi:hypothetical protein
MAQFSNEILNLFGGQALPDLTVCGAKELPTLPNYVDAVVWNFIFNAMHPDIAIVRLDLAILKQTNAAVEAYTTGRSQLLRFVDGVQRGEHRLLAYLSALTQFEHCIGAVWKASLLFNKMEHRALNKPFNKPDLLHLVTYPTCTESTSSTTSQSTLALNKQKKRRRRFGSPQQAFVARTIRSALTNSLTISLLFQRSADSPL